MEGHKNMRLRLSKAKVLLSLLSIVINRLVFSSAWIMLPSNLFSKTLPRATLLFHAELTNNDDDARSSFGTKEYWDDLYLGRGDFPADEYSWYFGWESYQQYVREVNTSYFFTTFSSPNSFPYVDAVCTQHEF